MLKHFIGLKHWQKHKSIVLEAAGIVYTPNMQGQPIPKGVFTGVNFQGESFISYQVNSDDGKSELQPYDLHAYHLLPHASLSNEFYGYKTVYNKTSATIGCYYQYDSILSLSMFLIMKYKGTV